MPPLVTLGEKLSASKAPRPAPLVGADEALPLAPVRLFGEAYRGSEEEKLGTELHDADDVAGPGPLPGVEAAAPPAEPVAAEQGAEQAPAPTPAKSHHREAEYAVAMAGYPGAERIVHAPPPPAPAEEKEMLTDAEPSAAAASTQKHAPRAARLPVVAEALAPPAAPAATVAAAAAAAAVAVPLLKKGEPSDAASTKLGPRLSRPPVMAESLAAPVPAAAAVPPKEPPATMFERVEPQEAVLNPYQEMEGLFPGTGAALEAMGRKEEAAAHAEALPSPEESVETPNQPPGWGFPGEAEEQGAEGVGAGETEALMGGGGGPRSDHPSPGPSPPRAGIVPRVVAVTLRRRPEVAKAAAATAAEEKEKEQAAAAPEPVAAAAEEAPGYTASQITAAPEVLLPEGENAYEKGEGGVEGVPTPAARPYPSVPTPAAKPTAPPAAVHVGTGIAAQPEIAPVPAQGGAGGKKKKHRGPIAGPLHKLAKEIKKAMAHPEV